ncbi:carbohydrate kinase family protein [Microbispora sp. RL4-1S]|uniref:Carbohydrate kinase family protein n=1 Tax=Microbispora oryzae TaxID=2806554 RepID=A0A941AH41_9ACTN|nr:carbohydrate kinase family protein [Microbispora oryzae]MBP2703675.1 carbohydrate kinase family protein [Microbispora oryzae]
MSVVTVGVHIVDVLARPVESIPSGQDTHLLEQIRITAAGAAAGTAVDLAKLGVPVASLGAVGDDELGDFLLMIMARHGVDVGGVVRRTGEQTAASILPIRPDGGRPSFHVPGANLGLSTADIDQERLARAKIVHLGGMDVTWGLHDPEFFALLDKAREAGAVVTMDLLSNMPDLMPAVRSFLPHVDYVLPNEEQALMLTGAATAAEAAAALLADGPRGALITLGAAGSLVVTPSGAVTVPALDVPVVDTTGCGDAYCAGFVAGLLGGRDVLAAARLATAVAARVAGGLGSDAGLDGPITEGPVTGGPLTPDAGSGATDSGGAGAPGAADR